MCTGPGDRFASPSRADGRAPVGDGLRNARLLARSARTAPAQRFCHAEQAMLRPRAAHIQHHGSSTRLAVRLPRPFRVPASPRAPKYVPALQGCDTSGSLQD